MELVDFQNFVKTQGDAYLPKLKDGCYFLHTPIPLNVPKDGKVHLKLGIKSQHTVLLIASDIFRPDGAGVIFADREIELNLVNNTGGTVLLEAGDTVIYAHLIPRDR